MKLANAEVSASRPAGGVRSSTPGRLMGDRFATNYHGGSFAKSAPIGFPSAPTGMLAEGR